MYTLSKEWSKVEKSGFTKERKNPSAFGLGIKFALGISDVKGSFEKLFSVAKETLLGGRDPGTRSFRVSGLNSSRPFAKVA